MGAAVVADALCTLGATHELGGLAIWSRRKLGPVSLVARRRPWARWIDGVRLQCAGRLEEAASALRAFLDEAATASGAAAAEPAVISYVSSHVAACHATLGDAHGLSGWLRQLAEYRKAAPSPAAAAAAAADGARSSSPDPFRPPVRASTLAALERLHGHRSPDGTLRDAVDGLSDDGVPAAVAAVWPWARAPHVHAAEAFAAALPADASGGDGTAPTRLDSLLERLRAEVVSSAARGGAGSSVAALPPLIELHAVALADARGGAERRAAWPPADALLRGCRLTHSTRGAGCTCSG